MKRPLHPTPDTATRVVVGVVGWRTGLSRRPAGVPFGLIARLRAPH